MEQSNRYQDLIRQILYEDWVRPNRESRGVAVTSTHPGAGTSYVCTAIRDGVNRMAMQTEISRMALMNSGVDNGVGMRGSYSATMTEAFNDTDDSGEFMDASQKAVIVDVRQLNRRDAEFGAVVAQSLDSDILHSPTQNGMTIKTRLDQLSAGWQESTSCRKECLKTISGMFRLVLLDVPPLRESPDIRSIAPLVEGVIVVVEANRATSKQLSLLTGTVDQAGGKILGYVLNKRTYPIPDWIYRHLERAGLT